MLALVKLLVFILFMGLILRLCSERLDDGSREVSVQIDINNMGGRGLSISVSRLAVEEEPERYRHFR